MIGTKTFLTWKVVIISTFLFFSSCLEDPTLQEVETEIKLRYLSGPLAGVEFAITTGSDPNGDLQFLPSKNITRVYCQPLQEYFSNRLKTSSSINFAWEGIPSTGEKLAVNANNPTEQWAGDIDIGLNNGDYITTSIPKNTKLQINKYPLAGELVEGQLNFSSFTNYKWEGITGQMVMAVYVEFKIVRSADGQ
ncbi:MAG: hypothetical protein IPM48_13920 [Saprospiraceae bacterium]|nr:hypothetical protein [Saprospiraceae bacterium]